jgi:hypothetical protein
LEHYHRCANVFHDDRISRSGQHRFGYAAFFDGRAVMKASDANINESEVAGKIGGYFGVIVRTFEPCVYFMIAA